MQPTETRTTCGNRWKFGKDECARTRGHIGPHQTTEARETHTFSWFDTEGVPSQSTTTVPAPARRLVAAGYVRRAVQALPAPDERPAALRQENEELRRAQALDDARTSHAAAFLAAIADQIGDRRISHTPVTADLWLRTSATAVHRTLKGLYPHTANDALVVALTARPEPRPGETCGEYALRLRATARSL
ncbi:hypothetical protein AB0H29_08350 [Streptomyces thermolilacinus]